MSNIFGIVSRNSPFRKLSNFDFILVMFIGSIVTWLKATVVRISLTLSSSYFVKS
jgi:hypothetical protein